jgi:S-adenosylmethionine decarboxylase
MHFAPRSIGVPRGIGCSSVHLRIGGNYDPALPEPDLPPDPPRLPGSLPGKHLIIEMHDAEFLTDTDRIDRALRAAIEAAQATLLALHHHVFTPSGGVTAIAFLAESHISIHTWPEENYAALDIFMCGACDPVACLPALTAAFQPKRLAVLQLTRGRDETAGEAPV